VHCVILGLGYVGLPLSVRAAEVGYAVTGFEPNKDKVTSLLQFSSYVGDVSEERLKTAIIEKGFRPTADTNEIEGFDIAVITVPTPLFDGVPDLSYVTEATKMLAKGMKRGSTVVLESTTYPGTTEEVVAKIIGDVTGMIPEEDYYLGFSPERIDPGNPTWDFQTTPKVISGIGPKSLTVIKEFYSTLCDTVVEVSSPKVAELAKILENTFRDVNIGFINEMAVYAHELGINIWEVIDAAATKPFGFMPFYPGPGTGGHCVGVDLQYMSWRVRTNLEKTFRFIDLANDINTHMPDYVVSRSADVLNDVAKPLKGSKILLLGKAYKAGTPDTRESPALKIIKLLTEKGADVGVEDPHVFGMGGDVNYSKYDLVVLVTAHEEFDYEVIAEQSKLILDCRHKFEAGPNVHYL
jgi:UDP-N-acetyl-D-glucosamine dehydrogenase